MSLASRICLLFVLASVLLVGQTSAQKESTTKKPVRKETTQKKSPLTASEREAEALRFAKRHHAELAALLKQLKAMDAKKYQSAIDELFKASERLSRYKDRTSDRYQFELDLWKIDSRIRLIVARSVNGMEDETREQVKRLLLKRNQIRLRQLTHEQKRQQDRLKRLGKQISQLKTESETLAERDLERLMRSVRNRTKTRKKPSPPAKTTPVTTKSPKAKNKKKTSP